MLVMRKEKNELSSKQEKIGKIISKFSEEIVLKGGFTVMNAGTFSGGVSRNREYGVGRSLEKAGTSAIKSRSLYFPCSYKVTLSFGYNGPRLS